MMTLQRVVEFVGTFAFALSGIRLAASKHYDWLGGFVCGVAVAIGGGTIRDVMLGVRPFWMLSPIYLICTLMAQGVVIVFHHYLKRLDIQELTEEIIQSREEISEQIKALKAFEKMCASYGFDVTRPAQNAREAVQFVYLAYLAAVKDQDGAAMSIGRTSTFLDIYIEKDIREGKLTEDWFHRR